MGEATQLNALSARLNFGVEILPPSPSPALGYSLRNEGE